MDPSENNQKETPNENNSPTIPSNNVVEPNLQSPLSEDSHLESKPTQPKVQTGPKKSKNWLLIILIIVVVITALVLAYIYLIKNKTTVTPKSHSVVIKKDISKVTLAINDDTDLTPNTPLSMTGSTEEFIVAYQMFDGLVGFQNQAKIIPGLAVSWSNPSDTTWDFNIRHNVKFHTGRTLTSNDVKFSLDYAVAHQSDQDNGTFALLAYGIKKVTVIDPYKIQIETNGPDATLLGQLANLFIVDSKASLTDPNSGTGAYKLSTSTLNGRVLDLTPFKDYWGGHVYTRELVITQNESKDDMASALINNKIDMGGNFQNAQLDTINSKAKKNNSYINNFKIQEPGSHYIQLNTARQNSPLSDINGRKAIEYALDVPKILKVSGIDGTPVNQLIPPELPGSDSTVTKYLYDLQKSKQLLASVKNLTTPLIFDYPAGDELQANEIAAELNAVGFNVKPTLVSDFSQFVGNINGAKADIFFLGYSSSILDGFDIINNVIGSTANYQSAQLNDLLSKGNKTFDPSQRIKLMQQMEQIIAKDVPVVPLFNENYVYSSNKPYIFKVDIPGGDYGIKFWQMYQK